MKTVAYMLPGKTGKIGCFTRFTRFRTADGGAGKTGKTPIRFYPLPGPAAALFFGWAR